MNGLMAGIDGGLGFRLFAPAAPAGVATPIAALHHHLGAALGYTHALSHPGGALLGLVVGGALWTAVEFSATSGRLPTRRWFAAIGWGLLLAAAPLISLGLAISLFDSAPSSAYWLEVGGLVVLSGVSVIALALCWDILGGTCLRRKSVLVLGRSSDWLELGARLAPGYDPAFLVAGVLSPDDRRTLASKGLKGPKIWGIVATDDALLSNAELRKSCGRARVRLLGEDEFRERWSRRIDIDRMRSGGLAARPGPFGSVACRFTRRLVDITLSLLLLITSMPVAALAAALIKLDSRGPVFYWQDRVGVQGRLFRLVKFRSMCVDAEAGSGPQWANLADPRVTRVGALLRRARIDELPQLWNVLRGEMSMIGPRPERPYFVAQLAAEIPCYNDRSLVKPGITGWAQVNYRYGASVEDARMKLAYDLYYVKHRSALLDLRILAATVRVVLFGEGAR